MRSGPGWGTALWSWRYLRLAESTTGKPPNEPPTITVTTAVALTLPAALLAVSRYVVVVDGATCLLVRPVTSPTPLSIPRLVAPVTDQVSVVTCPVPMAEGEAAKLSIVGAP